MGSKTDAFARVRSAALTFEDRRTVVEVRQGLHLALKGQIVASLDDSAANPHYQLWMKIVQLTVISAYVQLATTLPTTSEHLRTASFYMPYGIHSVTGGIDVDGNQEGLALTAMSITRITVIHPDTTNGGIDETTFVDGSKAVIEFKTGAGTVESFEFSGVSVHRLWLLVHSMYDQIQADTPVFKFPGEFRRGQQSARAAADELQFVTSAREEETHA